jgi:hypothetical protein
VDENNDRKYIWFAVIGLVAMLLALWQQHLEVQTWRAARDVYMDRCERLESRLLEAERMNQLLAEKLGKQVEQ